jgi:activator of HSP90 ATPase
MAWLNSALHSAITGADAVCSIKEGHKFTAWDGYISGKNLKLVPNKKIIQTWRTTDFKAEDKDSRIEISLKDVENGCQMTLWHSKIPAQQPDYENGWIEYYIKPMTEYYKK